MCDFMSVLWSGIHFVIENKHLEPRKPRSGSFHENKVVNCRCKWLSGPRLVQKCIILYDFGRSLANLGRFCGPGASLWSVRPLLSPRNLTLKLSIKSEWLITDITSVGPLVNTETDFCIHVYFWAFLANKGQMLKSGRHFVICKLALEP